MKNKFLARIITATVTLLLAVSLLAMTSDSFAANFAGAAIFIVALAVSRMLVVKFGMWSDISE